MSFLDKLMFWKKKEEPFGTDFGLGQDTAMGLGHDVGLGMHDTGLGSDFGLPTQMQQFPSQQRQPFQQPTQPYQYPSYQYPQATPIMPEQPSRQDMVGKDIEIVSSKLDALRATLESINQRLANLERVAYGEQERKRGW